MDEEDDEQSTSMDTADGEAKKKKRPKKKKNKNKEGADDSQKLLDVIDESTELLQGNACDDMPQEWTDITLECGLALKAMDVGEMIESQHFRLFDAMSAIEIMDPKMDSGFNNTEDITLERAAESGVIDASLKHDALVAIWDHLLMYFLLWLDGHTIVQTILSCLYLQDLETYVKPIPLFGAFVDGFLVACRKARGAILRANVFDDEDFLPNLFGIDLDMCVYSTVPKEVKERIEKECKSLRSSKSPAAKAVLWRLEFIAEFMLVLNDMGGEEALNGKTTQTRMDSAQRRLTTCMGLVEKMSQSCDVATPEALRCFDASINRKLLVPGPPRTVEAISDPRVAFSLWSSRIQELSLCCSVSQKPLAPLLEGAVALKEEPNVLTRSIATNCLQDTQGLVEKLMLDSLELFLLPPRDQVLEHCKDAAEAFLGLSEHLFSHLFKLTHYNRARRFRRLAHIFSDFNTLQHKAWSLDEELKQTFGVNLRYARPCWVWIMEQCLQIMLTKLFLGFELNLYDEAEFHMIYWYCDYLFGLRVYNMNELHYAKEQPIGGDKKKGRSARQAQQPPGRGGQRPKNPPPFLLILEATQACVRGLFRLLAFCLREDLLKAPSAVVDGLAQRFVLRFRALELFRLPHLPSFRDFQASSASAQAPVESRVVLDAAASSFGEAMQMLERLVAPTKGAEPALNGVAFDSDNVKSLKRVIVANQLAISQLLKHLESGKRSSVVVALSHHSHLVSLQVRAAE